MLRLQLLPLNYTTEGYAEIYVTAVSSNYLARLANVVISSSFQIYGQNGDLVSKHSNRYHMQYWSIVEIFGFLRKFR